VAIATTIYMGVCFLNKGMPPFFTVLKKAYNKKRIFEDWRNII